MSSAVAHALPPSILALFAPRTPIVYKPPIEKRRMLNYSTMAQFVNVSARTREPNPDGPQLALTTFSPLLSSSSHLHFLLLHDSTEVTTMFL